ncbi:hypothetical protein FQN54_003584 [Arachnomyces sp. PD_36]|nr:hypothetical protein FQN54_003584 [Arachnomyces sp. PD_36]
MLHSRLRPLPRNQNQSHRPPDPNTKKNPITASAETDLDLDDEDEDDEDPEDLFSCFLPHLLPDDAPSFHGDPGKILLYSSSLPDMKELEIMVPGYPDEKDKKDGTGVNAVKEEGKDIADVMGKEGTDDGRMLFAHYVWSAALLVAEGVEGAVVAETRANENGMGCAKVERKDMRWSVRGENVMELGAG